VKRCFRAPQLSCRISNPAERGAIAAYVGQDGNESSPALRIEVVVVVVVLEFRVVDVVQFPSNAKKSAAEVRSADPKA
jgi:hypothetical protein